MRILDEYLAAVQAVAPPDCALALAEHAALAAQLEPCLAGIDWPRSPATAANPRSARRGPPLAPRRPDDQGQANAVVGKGGPVREAAEEVGRRLAALAAVVSVLIAGVGLTFYQANEESKKGRLSLSTRGEPLTAEVSSTDRDERVCAVFTVRLTRSPVALPEGDYRVRLTAPRRRARPTSSGSSGGCRRTSRSSSRCATAGRRQARGDPEGLAGLPFSGGRPHRPDR